MGKGGLGFSKEAHLRKRAEFWRAYQQGAKIPAAHCVLYVLENGRLNSRLGITVSRKVGKAVVRNQVKRCVREAFRANQSEISPACDLVANMKRTAGVASCRCIQKDFLGALRRWRRNKAAEAARS